MSRTIQALLTIVTLTACGHDTTPASNESQLNAANGINFIIPSEDATYRFKGVDQTGKPCDVSIRTSGAQWITHLLLTGSFSGSGMATPSTMAQVDGGYEGVVDLFKGRSFTDFGYENHFFRPGVTLYSGVGRIEAQRVEAKLFGDSLPQLKEIKYSDRGPFLQISGTCSNLMLTSRQ
jgi:hypothetical protein